MPYPNNELEKQDEATAFIYQNMHLKLAEQHADYKEKSLSHLSK